MVRVTQRQNDTQYGHRKQERMFILINLNSHMFISVISVRSLGP